MKPKNILLIDDDKDDQEFFIEALRKVENISLVVVANSGKEALDMLENSILLPDLIFMDCNMPLMNGTECLNEIIQNPRTRDIPVFMLSSAIEQAELSRKLGAQGLIKKTFDLTALRIELNRVINYNIAINHVIIEQPVLN
jgi:CheY-like chemotaxis protein